VEADLVRENPDTPPAPFRTSQDAPVPDVAIEYGHLGASKLPENLEENPPVRREEVLSS